MRDISPTATLNNGVEMPLFGFGVYQAAPEDTSAAVTTALDEGYRLIDTAAVYGNERQVGEAIAHSGILRSHVFVTTKLWITDFGYEAALRAFDRSQRRLMLEQVDLYLLHFPVPAEFEQTMAAYKAAEVLLKAGRVRAIGVSNFEPHHLDRLLQEVDIVPAVNQVELHPYYGQGALRARHAELGILTQAWSPLGGVNIYDAANPEQARHLLDDPVVKAIADAHDRSPAQVVLRWHLQHGISVIPKSVKPARIRENSQLFDFALSAGEMRSIDVLETGVRGGPDPDMADRRMFPYEVQD